MNEYLNIFIPFARFINLYNQAILNSPKSDNLDERLSGLNAYFTRSIYENVCRSLFEKDKLIFSLVLTLGILRAKVQEIRYTHDYYGLSFVIH